MPSISQLEALSAKSRRSSRRCKVAEALAEYDASDRGVIEEALSRSDITDDAIRKVMQGDGITAMENARGPQSITFHRKQKCVCYADFQDAAHDG